MSKALKLLLVGQNDDGLAFLKETLTSDDVEVAGTASLGPAALTWAKIVEPDVVVIVADESLARPVAVTQALAHGDPSWTVVVLADRFERELVRQSMLVGARDILVRTSSPAELRQALATARRADLARHAPAEHGATATAGVVLTFAGVKGGVGKTTLAVNLAIALAQETARSVALVDLDLPFGDLAMLLNLKPEGNVMAALADPSILEDPDLLQRQLCAGPGGIQVLAAPLVAGGYQGPVDSSQVSPLLTRLAGLYDFVVVDTPGGIGELTAAALDVASQTLLVTTQESPTLRRTELGLRQLASWNYPPTRIKVLLNRATLRTGISSEEASGILSQPVAWWLVDEPGTLQAAAVGEPLILSHPKRELSRIVRAMARELAGLPEARRRSFWSLLLPRRKPAMALAA